LSLFNVDVLDVGELKVNIESSDFFIEVIEIYQPLSEFLNKFTIFIIFFDLLFNFLACSLIDVLAITPVKR